MDTLVSTTYQQQVTKYAQSLWKKRWPQRNFPNKTGSLEIAPTDCDCCSGSLFIRLGRTIVGDFDISCIEPVIAEIMEA